MGIRGPTGPRGKSRVVRTATRQRGKKNVLTFPAGEPTCQATELPGLELRPGKIFSKASLERLPQLLRLPRCPRPRLALSDL